MNNEIVNKNLELMLSLESGGILSLLARESCGGNAGYEGEHPCCATNFYFNQINGLIAYFENPQHTPKEIKQKNLEGMFRVLVNFDKLGKCFIPLFDPSKLEENWPYKIIGVYLPKIAAQEAQETIRESSKEFNKRYLG